MAELPQQEVNILTLVLPDVTFAPSPGGQTCCAPSQLPILKKLLRWEDGFPL